MTDFSRSTLTKWGNRFFEARTQSDIEDSEDVEGAILSEDEEDLKYVGFGGNRVCFSIPHTDEVVIFPRWGPENNTLHNGRECNLNEVEIWTSLVSAGKQSEYRFLPIRDYQDEGWWVIKPEITPVSEDTQEVIDEWEDTGKSELWDNVFGFSDHVNMMDLTMANACLWDGEFVWFDYGTKPQA